MRFDGEERGSIFCLPSGRGLCQMRSLAGEEADGQDMKLAEEVARADLAKEQASCHLRGESSPLSQSISMDGLLISLFPLFFRTLCAQFPSHAALVSVSRSTCTCMSMASKFAQSAALSLVMQNKLFLSFYYGCKNHGSSTHHSSTTLWPEESTFT
jgi:hypothetical protein